MQSNRSSKLTTWAHRVDSIDRQMSSKSANNHNIESKLLNFQDCSQFFNCTRHKMIHQNHRQTIDDQSRRNCSTLVHNFVLLLQIIVCCAPIFVIGADTYVSSSEQSIEQKHLLVANKLLERSASNVLTTLLHQHQHQQPALAVDISTGDLSGNNDTQTIEQTDSNNNNDNNGEYLAANQSVTQSAAADLIDDDKDDDSLVSALVSSALQEAGSPSSSSDNDDGSETSEESNNNNQTITTSNHCDQAYMKCALRKACAPALKAYKDECADLMANRTSQCTPRCVKAMIALRSSDEGALLATCDCQSSEYCRTSKQRALTCQEQVERAMRPDVRVSCSTATWICGADQLCATALEFYYRNCETPLLSERRCTARCNNSVAILYRQASAAKLLTCYCDGSEEFACQKYKTYTERLCMPHYSGNVPITTDANEIQFNTNIDSSMGANNFATIDNRVETSTIVLSSESSHQDLSGSNRNNNNQEPVYNPEDNWIPVINGRYFAQHPVALERSSSEPSEQQLQVADEAEQQAYNEFVAASLQQQREQQQQQQRQHHQRRHQRLSGREHLSYLSLLYTTSSAHNQNSSISTWLVLTLVGFSVILTQRRRQ